MDLAECLSGTQKQKPRWLRTGGAFYFPSFARTKEKHKAMKVYAKNIFLRLSVMKGEIEIQTPVNSKASQALAFFLRVIAIGTFVWLVLHGLAAIRWW